MQNNPAFHWIKITKLWGKNRKNH